MIKLLDSALAEALCHAAKESPRKRSHHNLHPELTDPVQRLCIALEPGTYLRPHRHPQSNKWELMLILAGRVGLLLFDDEGEVVRRIELADGGRVRGLEIPPNTWHSLFPIDDPALILEIKEGHYLPTAPVDFAPWSPVEGSPSAPAFVAWSGEAVVGDRYTGALHL
ncbi:MAG: WbuC family cupin fold metalloprotein [Gammaproteobacteria bacterium]|nr:WbuC family cupin fold metalloprotein [Gammaproteobacteria bacterium]MBU1653269.1 WbuC family cupin fold metalloprotein [Gammaproteobacteria bacterium]MBU1961495.1 WbuC family cupin fold metalloprotein [Gammaproteobacteria bacterium]